MWHHPNHLGTHPPNWISQNEDQHGHDEQSREYHKYAQAQCETSDWYCQLLNGTHKSAVITQLLTKHK